jgi:nucleotide-binding universal stress UspA family protein
MIKEQKGSWPGYKKILLPLGHKADINNLTELVSYIIDRRKGLVKFIHVIKQGSYIQLPSEWRTGAKRVTDSHHKMMEYGIHSDREIVTAETIERGILETSFDMEADAIILGWGPKPSSKISKMASNILDNSQSDVIIYKNRNDIDKVKNIMYPVAKAPALSRLNLIRHIMEETGADLTLTHFVDVKKGNRKRGEKTLESAKKKAAELGISAETLLLEGSSLISSIGKASEDFELLVIGPSGDWWLYQTLFGKKTDRIAEAVDCSVLLHRYVMEGE